VLESGGLEYEDDTQELARGTTSGDRYPDPDISRLRILGGSTNHWAGNCSPLDPIDFEKRSWLPHSGWPFSRADLDSYYRLAQQYCQLGQYNYDPRYWTANTDTSLITAGAADITTGVSQYSPPTNFGEVYRDGLDESANITVVLHANALEIELDEMGTQVEAIRLGIIGGDKFRDRARVFILAMGGIETPRLMLLSTKKHANGVGNSNDLVGRFFMDHPTIEGALYQPSGAVDQRFYDSTVRQHNVGGYLKLTPEALRREELLNVRIPFVPVSNYHISEGMTSLHALSDGFGEGSWPDRFWDHVGNIIYDMDMVLEGLSRGVFNQKIFDHADAIGGYTLRAMIEQTPDRNNRVTLSEDRDYFGQRRIALNWRISQRDRDNLWACYRILAAQLGLLKAGRIRLRYDNEQIFDDLLGYGHHHMGTTRASHDPKTGVVDRDLRVHELVNLYVAGSSIFPTGGHVPPTLTIVALSIRLAEHISKVWRRRA